MRRPLALVLLAALVPLTAPRAQSFEGLASLTGAPGFQAAGLSADGLVVVGTVTSGAVTTAYRWSAAGGLQPLGDLPGGAESAVPTAVSADGGVVVGYSVAAAGTQAFRWTAAGGMVALGDLAGGGSASYAYGVSADGAVVVGSGTSTSGTEAFRWTEAGGMVGLGDLPGATFRSAAGAVSADGLVVVGGGRSTAFPNGEAFRWTAAGGLVGLGDLPGGGSISVALGVSADGATVVGSADDQGAAFRWTAAGGMVALGVPAPASSRAAAHAVVDGGRVIAGESFVSGFPRATLWLPAGPRFLHDVLEDDYGLDLQGWTLWDVQGVSADGTVLVGTAYDAQNQMHGWRARVLPLTAVEGGAPADGLTLTVAPNPARGAATLTLTLDTTGDATVTVYDLLGRPLATLHDGPLAAGPHAFRLNAAALPAGVYVARAVTGGAVVTHRVTVVR